MAVMLQTIFSNAFSWEKTCEFWLTHWGRDKMDAISQTTFSSVFLWMKMFQLHQPRLWFITGGYLVKRWFIPAAARARGQPNDLNREILASNLFNCHKEVITAPQVPSISRCIHIVYQHKNVWEYQWSNFIYYCMSTFLHYVRCKGALLDCSAPGGERCESLTWVDEIPVKISLKFVPKGPDKNIPTLVQIMAWRHPGDKPLSEPMIISLPFRIQIMAWHQVDKPLS